MDEYWHLRFSKHLPAITTLFAIYEKTTSRSCMICKYYQQIGKQYIPLSGRRIKGKQTVNSKTPYAGF